MSELTLARTPQLIATEINTIKDQTRKMMLYNSIEIGRKLTEAKELVPHGEWGEWLEKSVDYSKSTANNLMRIFEEYGAEQITLLGDNAKSEALGKLSYSQAVALLGIPAEEREAFVEENEVEKMSTRELQQAIKERDEALKAKEAAEKEKDKIQSDLSDLERERKSSNEKISRLQIALMETDQKLKKVQNSGNEKEIKDIQESMKVLYDELAEARRKNAELEKQLREKPIDVPQIVEKIPDDVQKELEELRNKVSQVDNGTAKFKVLFDLLVKNFSSLLEVLEQIQDSETKEKYRNAIDTLISKMKEKL